MNAPRRRIDIDADYQAPPLSEWKQSSLDQLSRDILNAPEFERMSDTQFDAAVDEGIRRANADLGIHSGKPEPAWKPVGDWDALHDAEPRPKTFRQGQQRDRGAALLLAAYSILGLGIVAVIIGVVAKWPVLAYWWAK